MTHSGMVKAVKASAAITLTIAHHLGSTLRYLIPPWSEGIEVRICANQKTDDEDIAIELLEIYVQ